jgi:hypothetical protein
LTGVTGIFIAGAPEVAKVGRFRDLIERRLQRQDNIVQHRPDPRTPRMASVPLERSEPNRACAEPRKRRIFDQRFERRRTPSLAALGTVCAAPHLPRRASRRPFASSSSSMSIKATSSASLPVIAAKIFHVQFRHHKRARKTVSLPPWESSTRYQLRCRNPSLQTSVSVFRRRLATHLDRFRHIPGAKGANVRHGRVSALDRS